MTVFDTALCTHPADSLVQIESTYRVRCTACGQEWDSTLAAHLGRLRAQRISP